MNPGDAREVRETPPLRPVGGGGMGEVSRADDLKLSQRVALEYVPTREAVRTALAGKPLFRRLALEDEAAA